MWRYFSISSVFLLFSTVLWGQVSLRTDSEAEQFFRRSISFLAHDSLEGRLAGSEKSFRVVQWLIQNFQRAGLHPPQEGYVQRFPLPYRRKVHPSSFLRLRVRKTWQDVSWLPARFSGSDTLEGEVCLWTCSKSDTCPAGSIVYVPYTCLEGQTARDRIHLMVQMAHLPAKAVLLGVQDFSALEFRDTLSFFVTQTFPFPILFVQEQGFSPAQISHGQIQVEFFTDTSWGYNVIGVLPCSDARTCSGKFVVVCAHFDHLGRGQVSGIRGEPGPVYNGADDNASGTAMLVALAYRLAQWNDRKHHYLFVAFDAEEEGLLGSRFFVEHSPVALEQVLAVVNFDMVGRLDSVLMILGTQSSEVWDTLIPQVVTPLLPDSVRLRTGGEGLGSSDHASFFRKEIPVLHFFTGLHADYHRPTDDAERIHYAGMVQVLRIAENLLSRLNHLTDIPFREEALEESSHRNVSAFRVTLGILPDYAYSGKGVRIDGVIPGRPADRAGIQSGDVIVEINGTPIENIYTYMDVLGRLEPGDTIDVVVLRQGEHLRLKVLLR